MQTLTLQVTHNNALKTLTNLEKKQYIRIVQQADLDSPVFPGDPLTVKQFKKFILSRENGPAMSLKEAEAKWEKKKKELLKLAK